VSADPYASAVADVARALAGLVATFEKAQRRLHPPSIPALRQTVGEACAPIASARDAFRAASPPPGLEPFHAQLLQAADAGVEALHGFTVPGLGQEAVPRVLASLRAVCRVQEALYPLRFVLPPLRALFLEPKALARVESLDPENRPEEARVGFHVAGGDEGEGRGGFSLYVPESCVAGEARPLVVALHGGFGHGRDFLWTWLRECKTRRCLLLAPTSQDTTWSMMAPDVDGRALRSMVSFVTERWPIDAAHVLLTGLSDGATFSLIEGLAEGTPFTHVAPVSGVLHPLAYRRGDVGRARGRRIYLVHGAQDWMFPIEIARVARDALQEAGADLVWREIEDLSHTYPREENAHILEWMDPALALPEA
jgi:phospholipase/carboxylesterase